MTKELRRASSGWANGDPTERLAPLPTDETSDEYWFARHMTGLVESGAMFHGRFVEVHVARLLGAHLPTTGINDWDLLVPDTPPIRVEVKTTTGPKGSFTLSSKDPDAPPPAGKKRRRPHVWVFVHSPDRTSREFSYLVAPDTEIRKLGGTITLNKARKTFEEVTAASLRNAVKKAAPSRRPR